jgi:hypothetical protein
VWDFDHAEFRFAKDAKSATEIVDLNKADKTKKMNERLAQFFSEQMDLVPSVPIPRPETDTTYSRLTEKVGGRNGSLEDLDIINLFDLLKNKAGNEHFDYHAPLVWDDNAVGRKNKGNPRLFDDIIEKAREKAKLIAVPLRIKGDYVIVFFDVDKKKRYIFDPKGTTRLDDLNRHFIHRKFWLGWKTVPLKKKIQKDNYNSGSYIYHLTRLLVASKDPEKDFTDYAELSKEDLAKQKAEWAKDVKPAEVPEALPVPAKKWWEFWKKA